jgi:hypothetical protein
LGLFFLFGTSRFPWIRLCGAVICFISLYKIVQQFFFPQLGFHLPNLSQHSNPLNIIGFFLIGTLYLLWKREQTSQIQFFYAFFVAFATGGLAVLALLAYIFGFADVYGNTHLFGMITLIFVDIGLMSAVVYFEITLRANRYRWVPVTIGFTLVVLALILSFGLYLYEQYGQSPGLLQLLTVYGLIGGFIFAALGATLAYFWLLSSTQLRKSQRDGKRLEIRSGKRAVGASCGRGGDLALGDRTERDVLGSNEPPPLWTSFRNASRKPAKFIKLDPSFGSR